MNQPASALIRKCALVALLAAAATGSALGQNPFTASAALRLQPSGDRVLTVSFGVPAQHDLYADAIDVAVPGGVTLVPLQAPVPVRKPDAFGGGEHAVFTNDVRFVYRVAGVPAGDLEITVGYQGCGPTLCYLPASTRISLAVPGAHPAAAAATDREAAPPAGAAWTDLIRGFTIAGRETGYLGPEAFLRFLDESESGAGVADNLLQKMMAKNALWAWFAILLIVAGGFGLNLTPCVLPMIPINISILGAGVQAGSRARGFLLGCVYAGAMALAYGSLGAGVVLTGAKFGLLNSSPLFNAIVAVIFLALALAMFEVYFLDFSRFQGSRLLPSAGHGFLTAFVMGAVAALLAGSCVAPILVSVLLLAADLYKRGEALGLLLPFLLGLGMGLPWPFLGAGLSFLPPPGKWMLHVKRVFGIVILGCAVYYGQLAYRLYRERAPQSRAQVTAAQQASQEQGWFASLPAALAEARRQNKPVLIDFWASWCKNCLAMDETTFRNPRVGWRLDAYVKVKFRAEQLNDPEVKSALDYFGAVGLPTYLVLQPAAAPLKAPAHD